MTDIKEQKNELVEQSTQDDALVSDIHINERENKKLIESITRLTKDKEILENNISELAKQKDEFGDLVKEKEYIISDINTLNVERAGLIKIKNDISETILRGEEEVNLNSWAAKRDGILSEIAVLEDKKVRLSKQNTELANSYTEISKKIEKIVGRMEELDKTEKLYGEIVDTKILELETRKIKLTSDVDILDFEVKTLENKKESLIKDIMFLITTQEDVFNRTGILEKVVEHVTNVSSKNIKELDTAVTEINKKAEKILSLSDTNIKAHTDILNEIPRLFVELSKKTLTRQKI